MDASGVMHCEYCAAPLVPSHGAARIVALREYELPDPDLPRLWLGGRRYVIEGRLGRGDSCDVYLGRWDHRLKERVVLKVLRDDEGREIFDNGSAVLSKLQAATHQGRDHFTRLLPQPIAHGEARLGINGAEGRSWVSVYRYMSGFIHSFRDVRAVYPSGIDPAASIWLWMRIAELLTWVHSTGWIHGAVLPAHLLVHARDHGVYLVGWSRSVRSGAPPPAFSASDEQLYPRDVWRGGGATTRTDLAMSARCIEWLLSGARSPRPLEALLRQCSGGGASDAATLLGEIRQVGIKLYGPPRYVPFEMPGWTLPNQAED
jgi:hypothetical protein